MRIMIYDGKKNLGARSIKCLQRLSVVLKVLHSRFNIIIRDHYQGGNQKDARTWRKVIVK